MAKQLFPDEVLALRPQQRPGYTAIRIVETDLWLRTNQRFASESVTLEEVASRAG